MNVEGESSVASPVPGGSNLFPHATGTNEVGGANNNNSSIQIPNFLADIQLNTNNIQAYNADGSLAFPPQNTQDWELPDPDKRKPFRPGAASSILEGAHYYHHRLSIRDAADIHHPLVTVKSAVDATELVAEDAIEIVAEKPTRAVGETSPFAPGRLEGLDNVCKQTIELLANNETVESAWTNHMPNIKVLQSVRSLTEWRYASSGDDRRMDEVLKPIWESWKQEGYVSTAPKAFSQTTPEILYALYRTTVMRMNIIIGHLEESKIKDNEDIKENEDIENIDEAQSKLAMKKEKKKEKTEEKTKKKTKKKDDSKKGPSASGWEFRLLVDLSCIPLSGLNLEAIIPSGFKEMSDAVVKAINSRYIVRRTLNEITMATKNDLSVFSEAAHMSWFMLNPWFLFFMSLRDHLTRGEAEAKTAVVEDSRLNETRDSDEGKLEETSEQLLHRFMEVVLLLFSIICDGRDDFRSTPGRVKDYLAIGSKKCEIQDDGYVYLTRGGTFRTAVDGARDEPSDRSRYGKVPIMRYEAKRLHATSDFTAQIFSELLSAAVINMKYLEVTDPHASEVFLPSEITGLPPPNRTGAEVLYHDAFVIHMHHYSLTIHTARFPTTYLKWVTTQQTVMECPSHYCILHKVSTPYDLSEPTERLNAARDMLILLWAIKNGNPEEDGRSLFVARAVLRQTIGPKAVVQRTERIKKIEDEGKSSADQRRMHAEAQNNDDLNGDNEPGKKHKEESTGEKVSSQIEEEEEEEQEMGG